MGPKLNFQKVGWGSAAYALTVALRYDMLREPLGLHFNLNDLDYEQDSVHWAGFSEEGEVLACLVLRPASTASVLPEHYSMGEAYQMRQVAVKPSYQGLGLGRALVLHSQHWLRDQLNARLVFCMPGPKPWVSTKGWVTRPITNLSWKWGFCIPGCSWISNPPSKSQ